MFWTTLSQPVQTSKVWNKILQILPVLSGFSSSSLLLSSLGLRDTKVKEPYTRALLGTASHFCVERFSRKCSFALLLAPKVDELMARPENQLMDPEINFFSSLLFSSLEWSDTKVYEP